MNNKTTFVFAAALTACLSFAGIMINADTTLLATSVGVATVGSCELKGEVVEDEDGIYAVFTVTNSSEEQQDVEFFYGVSFLAPMAPYSRMMPMPAMKKKGKCSMVVAGSGSKVEKIQVQGKSELATAEHTEAVAELKPAVPSQVPARGFAPATWTLSVSRSDVRNAGFGMAVPLSAIPKMTELGEGTIILATRIAEPALTQSL